MVVGCALFAVCCLLLVLCCLFFALCSLLLGCLVAWWLGGLVGCLVVLFCFVVWLFN